MELKLDVLDGLPRLVRNILSKEPESSEWLSIIHRFLYHRNQFNILQNSFPEIVRRWNVDTPRHFRFTAKFPSIITHEKRLERVNSEVFSFLSSLALSRKNFSTGFTITSSLSFEEAKPRLEEIFDALPDNFVYQLKEDMNHGFLKKQSYF